MSSRTNSISVIIPALNEEAHLSALLRLLVKRPPFEIIVADGGSTDQTVQLSENYGVEVVRAPAGRGRQMNHGAEAASGEILFFVHADSLLPETWQEEILRLLNAGHLAGSFLLRFDEPSFWLDFYSRCSRINHWLFTYGDQGLFIRRKDFMQAGGFRELDFLEDVHMIRQLHRTGNVVKSHLAITTSARRFRKNGIVRQQLRNIMILTAYLAGIPAQRLARFYPNS